MKDLIGQKFNRWTVINRADNRGKHIFWLCKCDCGNSGIINGHSLRIQGSKSCGCYAKENPNRLTHGMSHTKIHSKWLQMKDRCGNPKYKNYDNYGGRGIKVCDKWFNSFEKFYEDVGESYKKHCKKHGEKNTTLDRFPDQNGNYCLENTRWATMKVQCNNKTNNVLLKYKGKTKTLMEWTVKLNLNYKIMHQRLSRDKMSVKKAFETSIKK